MRKAVPLCAAAAALCFFSGEAMAQRQAGQGWSVVTGRTVGTGNNVVHVQAGWPGISATLLHGQSSTVDLGGIFTFNYGYEGDTEFIWPGLKLQGLGKATLMDDGKFNLGGWFAPGGFVYFPGSRCFRCSSVGGIAFPVGLTLGIPATSAVNLSVNVDLPFFVSFGNFNYFVIPLFFGGGIEYFLERNMAITFNLRMGPMIYTGTRGGTDFGFNSLIGLAFKI